MACSPALLVVRFGDGKNNGKGKIDDDGGSTVQSPLVANLEVALALT